MTAAYLARTLATAARDGVRITVIESSDTDTVGVGEGTSPSIQHTLRRMGFDEGSFLRASSATFTQGIRFAGWRLPPAAIARNDYFHLFESALIRRDGLDLLPYWLLGLAPGIQLDEAASVQKCVAEASRAPKSITDDDFGGPLSYAYHFDGLAFARTLRVRAKQLGVQHVTDAVVGVELDQNGAIVSLITHEHGDFAGDLYVDCTGSRAELIGRTLGIPLRSCRSTLFCDRAVTMQVPYDRADAPIASYTKATAHEAGWTWDIGLHAGRSVGCVYSSAHGDDRRAERVLRDYVGAEAGSLRLRQFRFEPGYREVQWHRNCVAIGLAACFFEPLEATGLVFIEAAVTLLAHLFPWNAEFEVAARQFNRIMTLRYRGVLDFLKLHYCLTQRRDTAFWRDNARPESIPDSLQDLLHRWRFRPPEGLDFDPNIDPYSTSSWQFVLYGMGFRTDLRARQAAFSHPEEARQGFADIAGEARLAAALLPGHRELLAQVYRDGFSRSAAS
jgi:tryptophan halogenase